MAIGRSGTLTVYQNTISNFGKVQRNLADLQKQISSGIKTTSFEGLTGDVERFVNLEAKIKQLKTYETNNTENIARLQNMRNSVANIIEITDDIEDLMTLRRNDALADGIAFEQNMKGKLRSLINALNSNIGGRFLFGGTKTNVPPVVEEPPLPVEDGVADAGYYQGSKENIIIRTEDGAGFEQDIRADDVAFQKIISAITSAIDADAKNDKDAITRAMDMLQSGLKDAISIQSKLDSRIVEIKQVNERHESTRLYFKGIAEDIAQTDILAATTKVAIDKTILTATFQSFGRISSLSLTDYIR